VLGSGYQKELLAQVPKENLPKQFGGDCECAGGCQLSDQGPCKLINRILLSTWRYTDCSKQGKIPSGPRPQHGPRRTKTPSRPLRATSGRATLHPPHQSLGSPLARLLLCLRFSRRSHVSRLRCFNMTWVFCVAGLWAMVNWCW
jgi:hypothetical protein